MRGSLAVAAVAFAALAAGAGALPAAAEARGPDLDVLFIGAHPDDEAGGLSTYGAWAEERAVQHRRPHDHARRGRRQRGRPGGGPAARPDPRERGAARRRAARASADVFNLDEVDFYYTVSAPLTRRGVGRPRDARAGRPRRARDAPERDRDDEPGARRRATTATTRSRRGSPSRPTTAAADPRAFRDQITREGLRPWRVERLFRDGAEGEGATGPRLPESLQARRAHRRGVRRVVGQRAACRAGRGRRSRSRRSASTPPRAGRCSRTRPRTRRSSTATTSRSSPRVSPTRLREPAPRRDARGRAARAPRRPAAGHRALPHHRPLRRGARAAGSRSPSTPAARGGSGRPSRGCGCRPAGAARGGVALGRLRPGRETTATVRLAVPGGARVNRRVRVGATLRAGGRDGRRRGTCCGSSRRCGARSSRCPRSPSSAPGRRGRASRALDGARQAGRDAAAPAETRALRVELRNHSRERARPARSRCGSPPGFAADAPSKPYRRARAGRPRVGDLPGDEHRPDARDLRAGRRPRVRHRDDHRRRGEHRAGGARARAGHHDPAGAAPVVDGVESPGEYAGRRARPQPHVGGGRSATARRTRPASAKLAWSARRPVRRWSTSPTTCSGRCCPRATPSATGGPTRWRSRRPARRRREHLDGRSRLGVFPVTARGRPGGRARRRQPPGPGRADRARHRGSRPASPTPTTATRWR